MARSRPLFLSTLSLRRATHYDNYNLHCVEISIHALLAESDSMMLSMVAILILFLSTLSLRRATAGILLNLALHKNFYPRSPCGERPASGTLSDTSDVISIHALLAESDHPRFFGTAPHTYFYPRSPCGERPPRGGYLLS